MTRSVDETPEPARAAPEGSAAHKSGPEKPGPDWETQRRLAEIFGDVLPTTTRDERDPEQGSSAPGESGGDAWLRRQVPPHHGGH